MELELKQCEKLVFPTTRCAGRGSGVDECNAVVLRCFEHHFADMCCASMASWVNWCGICWMFTLRTPLCIWIFWQPFQLLFYVVENDTC